MPMKRGGLAKLTEEAGEVIQVCAKEDQVGGLQNFHWSGDLTQMLEDELGDLQAAIEFVIERNALNKHRVGMRRAKKLKLFWQWDKE